MENIINDVKVVETDDGFRIDIKGDKEAIRKILDGFASGFPFGPDFGFDFGPGFWDTFKGWCGPWWGAEGQDKRA